MGAGETAAVVLELLLKITVVQGEVGREGICFSVSGRMNATCPFSREKLGTFVAKSQKQSFSVRCVQCR